MSWQDRVEALRGRIDPSARAMLVIVFEALVPARPDLATLLAEALTPPARRRPALPAFPAADGPRLHDLCDLLEGPLGELCVDAASREDSTGAARTIRAAMRRPEIAAARQRLRELAGAGLRPYPPRSRGMQLDALPLAGGMQLGCWHLWKSSLGVGVLLHHAASGRLVRVWTGSNGWWEFRTKAMAEEQVHTIWSAGNNSRKHNESYARVENAPGPCWTVPPGAYIARDWRFYAGKCELLIAHTPTGRVITLGLAEPLLRCNDADLPDLD